MMVSPRVRVMMMRSSCLYMILSFHFWFLFIQSMLAVELASNMIDDG